MTADEGRREYWTRTAVLVLSGGAYAGGGIQALRCLSDSEPWSWAEMLESGGVWAVGMILVSGLARIGWFPSRGDSEGRALLRDALATGELPLDARPSAWATLLEGEIRKLAKGRWVTATLALSVALLVAAAAVTTGDPGVWVLAIALGGFVGVPLRLLNLRKERAEGLLARVLAG